MFVRTHYTECGLWIVCCCGFRKRHALDSIQVLWSSKTSEDELAYMLYVTKNTSVRHVKYAMQYMNTSDRTNVEMRQVIFLSKHKIKRDRVDRSVQENVWRSWKRRNSRATWSNDIDQ